MRKYILPICASFLTMIILILINANFVHKMSGDLMALIWTSAFWITLDWYESNDKK